VTPQVPFNPAQICTWAKAMALAHRIHTSAQFQGAGIHVLPRTQNMDTSGVYIPTWVAGPGGFGEPQNGNEFFLHFRYSNGMEGMNCGLVREKFASFPLSPEYVLGQLLIEVQAGAKS
jgi:hypothetical protein